MISPIGDQAAASNEEAFPINRRQLVLCRQRNDQIAVTYRRTACYNDETSIRRTREGLDGLLDLANVVHVDWNHFQSERRPHRLQRAKLRDLVGISGIPKDCHSRQGRCDLFQQLEPLPTRAVFEVHEASDVATWPRQALDITSTNRIDDNRKDDRQCARQL